MSSPPIPYDRQAHLGGFSAEQFPTVGQDLDAEFNRVGAVMRTTQSRLSEIHRDDWQPGIRDDDLMPRTYWS